MEETGQKGTEEDGFLAKFIASHARLALSVILVLLVLVFYCMYNKYAGRVEGFAKLPAKKKVDSEVDALVASLTE